MKIINCNECGTVCLENPSKLCPICQKKVQQEEDKVIEYLYDHPKSSLEEIHNATKVTRHFIMAMIRRGQLLEGTVSYSCENCMEQITSGRFCTKCTECLMEEHL